MYKAHRFLPSLYQHSFVALALSLILVMKSIAADAVLGLNFSASAYDSIRETGATPLLIDGFDQQGQYVDLGLRGTWHVMDRMTAHADLGTSLPLFESSDDIHASFATSGSTMKIQPSALIDQTIYFGLGMRYDLEGNLTAGVNWRCETWNHGKPLHNLGAGITWGF